MFLRSLKSDLAAGGGCSVADKGVMMYKHCDKA